MLILGKLGSELECNRLGVGVVGVVRADTKRGLDGGPNHPGRQVKGLLTIKVTWLLLL